MAFFAKPAHLYLSLLPVSIVIIPSLSSFYLTLSIAGVTILFKQQKLETLAVAILATFYVCLTGTMYGLLQTSRHNCLSIRQISFEMT